MSDIQKAIDGLSRAMELTEVLGAAAMKNVWHPIETAPKDGTSVLVRATSADWDVGEDCSSPRSVGHLTVPAYHDGHNWIPLEDFGAGYVTLRATHWMPLPEPPRDDNG